MSLSRVLANAAAHAGALADARHATPGVLRALLAPTVRGLLLQRGKAGPHTELGAHHAACFDWTYLHDRPDMGKLHRAAREGQWDPDVALDWSIPVDPWNPNVPIVTRDQSPLPELPAFRRLSLHEQLDQQRDMVAWLLSQFLHGEQGALFVACQLTEAVTWTDGKLYGSTQVVDEGRHVEVFDRYLAKLEKRYAINDNLYVILDAIMTDGRWDLKFLGMQILIEGLALGAFGTLRAACREPLLRELLRNVITDEARHVQFGVVALQGHLRGLPEAERREREDWALEMCLLLRNRFLAHEFYEERWAHAMSRREWDRFVLSTEYMKRFRVTMFRRIVPNLKRIGLLTDRVRPHYAALNLLSWENEKAAPEVAVEELVG
jgi:hypothetical protein